MQHKIEKCKIHQEQAIALECRSDKDQHYQVMCENCLIERFNDRNILSLKDADKLKEKLLNHNQTKQKDQIDENINSLTRMNMIVRQLSENYTSFFDQINRQINEWIKSIGQRNQEISNKENQLNTKFYDNLFGLKQFGMGAFGKIYKFEEYNSISQYQYEILQEMMKLQQSDLFDQCLDSIVTYSEEKDLMQMTDKNQSTQNQTSKKTPNLDLICQDHEKEIILFDLNEQSEKEKRAKCIECDPCLFTSLSKFQILWKQFEKQQYDIISQFHISRKTQIGLVKNQLYALKSNLIEKINQVLLQLNEFMFSSEREVEKCIQDMGQNWNSLTFAEVLERAEIISKPNLQKKQLKDLEIKYKMKNWYIDSLMKTNLDELSQIQFSFNNLLQGIQENLVQEDGIIVTTLNGFQSTIGSDQKKIRSNSVSSEKKKISLKEQRTDQKLKKAHNKHKSLEESQIMQFRLSDKLVSYQLIFSKKQTEWCNAMALNSQGNILVAGCKYVIKIFDLVKGKIIQTFIAKQHSGDVNCLLFSQKEQIFFSGSDDKTIRVWSQSEQPEWKCIQALKGHQDWILCILLSKCESLLYSGSRDNTIKVWTRNYEKKTFSCCQTLSAHTDAVLGLSLNEKETLLASCSYDKTLVFWNIKENLQYQKGQVIQNQNYGNRLLFINDTQLLWQPNNNETPVIFTLNEEKELFEETNHNIQQIQADDDYLFFPAVMISTKEIFLNVHNNYIYIIKQLNNEEFEILQIIEFEDYRKFGTISQDGEYLITWDYASSEIQVRRNVGTSRMQ